MLKGTRLTRAEFFDLHKIRLQGFIDPIEGFMTTDVIRRAAGVVYIDCHL